MKVGILTQYYPPEVGAAQVRLSELAARLRARGHDVTVLTTMPSYPQAKVHQGYGGLFRRETESGVCVLRSWIWPSRSSRIVPRTASYFSFVVSSLIAGALTLPRIDVLITESPPLPLGVTGYLLSRLKRARWVFNVSDLWPESAVLLGVLSPNGVATRLAYRLEAFCYRKAWRVSGQIADICANIERRFPGTQVLRLAAGVDTQRFDPANRSQEMRRSLGGETRMIALYAGLHGLAQGLDQILDAARLVADDVVFVFVGDGPEKATLQRHAQDLRLGNVHFLEPRPRELMPALVASADVALVPLREGVRAVPSKLFEGLASGVPVLLVSGGEAAEIVVSAGAGLAVEPGDVAGIAAALTELAAAPEARRRMGEAGRALAVESFDRSLLCDVFIDALEHGPEAEAGSALTRASNSS